ncbi:helix-turn-helix domain-containing protein [Streptomyces globisporus]|uniref:helix-turn-helix domain-containing protein n=1 Tax=Streptomyces TaxID=1883 RepID=UPI00052616DB|nr:MULTISPECIES: helix-turn-helix domain-containing protein [Streptomyces]MCQ1582632.1 helix-turn-helix domain-containing protein [Streptomyces parvus]
MDASTESPWLTVREVAEHYRVSTRTITRWVATGEIRSHRIGPGRLVRIHRSEIETEQQQYLSEAS